MHVIVLKRKEEPLRNRRAEAEQYIQEQQLRNPRVDFIPRAEENELAFRQTNARIPTTTTTTTTTETSPGKTCNVCLEDKEASAFEALTCGHSSTCNDCLTQMVNTMIKEKDTTSLKCPNCARQIQENEIRRITNNDGNKLEAYSDIATEEYLAKQNNVQQCPTADCPYKFFNENYDPQIILCPSCHARYCSKCLTNHPEKTPCNITENVNNKETQKWLDQNTKACPQCHALIQKVDGCNHVTCKRCQAEFCFNCLELAIHIRCTKPPQSNTSGRTINNLQPQQNREGQIHHHFQPRPQPVPQEILQQMIAARGAEENRRIAEREIEERRLAGIMLEARRLERERMREARRRPERERINRRLFI